MSPRSRDLAPETSMDGRHLQQHGAVHLSTPHSTRLRTSESWIDVASRPPSPSLSPGINNDISHNHLSARRRRRRDFMPNLASRRPSVDCSSQEEYDESESESDRVMTSSNECLVPSNTNSPILEPPTSTLHNQNDGQDDAEDENLTTIAAPSSLQCFTPQPNAFSHPPSSQTRQHDTVPGSYFPAVRQSTRPNPNGQSHTDYQARRIHTHSPYNMAAPSHQTDHDAALRASLSTLLSCAAAARGLPKSSQNSVANGQHATSSRVDLATLRMVPEAVVLGELKSSSSPGPNKSTSSSHDSLAGMIVHEKGKRKAVGSSSKDRRVVKKARQVGHDESISPTLLTWVTAAGVVVLVSALSFSTGYVIGRETGRMEAGSGLRSASTGVACGKEGARSGLGLKRLRWGGAVSVVAA